jgi:flagellin
MPDIVLSSAVRDNLLSLKKTAAFQETTQNRLATGLKVNSALDNPNSYFTAQSLNDRPAICPTCWTTWDRPFRRCALLMTA